MSTLLLSVPGSESHWQDREIKKSTVVVTELPLEDPLQDDAEREHHIPQLSNLPNITHIISSPYQDLSNQLDLRPLATPSRLLAIALSSLAVTRADYATAPYLEIFNWSSVFGTLRTLCSQAGIEWQVQEFHVVIFRSQLRKEADRRRLGELDQKSHEEACASGGLLKYWFGSCDEQRRNLATCIWRSREDAAAGGRGPWHRQARAAAREMYEHITFETHKLVVEAGAESWRLERDGG